jgi:hypothetical protein
MGTLMTLHFPNASRNYNPTQRCVCFWGHDSAFEVSFTGRPAASASKATPGGKRRPLHHSKPRLRPPSLMASPQNALLNLSAPAALPWSFNEWIRIWRQSEKYRQNAAECYKSIRILSDPLDRAKMLARVQAWILLADQAERNSHPNLKTMPRPESPIK